MAADGARRAEKITLPPKTCTRLVSDSKHSGS
jgi:hypothetical protein